MGDIVYVGGDFSVCATYILEISDYVGAFSICATYILEISDYVGLFSVCVTYIFGDVRLRWRVYRPCNVYQFGRIWIKSECLFKGYFDETRLCSILCYVYLGERSLFTLALSAHVGIF